MNEREEKRKTKNERTGAEFSRSPARGLHPEAVKRRMRHGEPGKAEERHHSSVSYSGESRVTGS